MSLHLSKTILPLTPPSATHAFCIITSQIRSRGQICSSPSERSSSLGFRSSISTEPRSSFSCPRTSATTPTESRGSISAEAHRQSTSSDGYFPPERSDRSVSTGRTSRIRSKGSKASTLSIQHMLSAAEEHWALLENFDWSKTKLGPSERWVEAIGPLLSITFQSKTQDCLWLGDDLQLI